MAQKSEQVRAKLDGGLIPAVPVMLDERGRLHGNAHEAYLRHMSEQPLAGVAVWAHTGRGLMLDVETADTVLRDWRNALPNQILIAGAGARSVANPDDATTQSLKMAERAARIGADALLVYAPSWLIDHPQRDQRIIEHHRRLAATGMPLVLFYLYEEAGGISYSEEVLDELLSIPEVIGIKMATLDSVMTYQDVSRQLTLKHPHKLLITGEDRFLGYSLQRGARAALIGMGAVCCRLQADLIRSHIEGDAGRFFRLSNFVDQLAEATFIRPMEGYIKRLLWVLVQQGVIPFEAANDPWGPELPQSDREMIAKMLATLHEVE
jgi:4-hydroxy-tetrahydrodipicolinate synthase